MRPHTALKVSPSFGCDLPRGTLVLEGRVVRSSTRKCHAYAASPSVSEMNTKPMQLNRSKRSGLRTMHTLGERVKTLEVARPDVGARGVERRARVLGGQGKRRGQVRAHGEAEAFWGCLGPWVALQGEV